MKAVASLVFGVVGAVGACIAAISVASVVMADPAAHRFETLTSSSSDLWTNVPVRVDATRQNYQRVPAAYSTYVTDPPEGRVSVAMPEAQNQKQKFSTPSLSSQHVAWCSSRYRSYTPASDSYRAFSGEMKICVSPYSASLEEGETIATGSASKASADLAWCTERYQSYRASDNTYQPHTGPRRVCTPPDRREIASAN